MKSLKFRLLILGVIVIVGTSSWIWTRSNPNSEKNEGTPVRSEEAPVSALEKSPSDASQALTNESAQPEVAAPGGEPPQPNLVSMIPAAAELRKEVEKNPHATPKQILKFSNSIVTRLETLKSPTEARQFINELEECVDQSHANPDKIPGSIESLCLLNARRTRDKYPELESRYNAIRAKASDDAKLLNDSIK